MIEIFNIQHSRTQFVLLGAAAFFCAVAALVNIDDLILRLCCSGLCGLLGWSECAKLKTEKDLQLRLDSGGLTIHLQQDGQSYFYIKYKVYPTRWFAILRLTGETENRTLLLNSDRFQTVQDYQAMRYRLCQMERVTDAA